MSTDRVIERKILDGLGCGLVLFDGRGRPVEANVAAAHLLLERDALRIDGGRICARDPATTEALRALVSAALSERRTALLSLARVDGKRPVIAVVTPLAKDHGASSGGAAIVLADAARATAPMTEALSGALGLSVTDARALAAASRGLPA